MLFLIHYKVLANLKPSKNVRLLSDTDLATELDGITV
jgi:hypothetical protein